MKKLRLKKDVVVKLSENEMEQIRGGALADRKINQVAGLWSFVGDCTGGCTDGCGIMNTEWNCTKTECSANCDAKGTLGTLSKMNACHTCTCL